MAERDERGRFISSGNPAGRPRGSQNKINREIRELIREALDQEGGSQYLRQAARENPAAFLSLVGRLVPAEIKGVIESDVVINVVTGISADAPGSGDWEKHYHLAEQRKAELPGEPPPKALAAGPQLVREPVCVPDPAPARRDPESDTDPAGEREKLVLDLTPP